jgi:hypothetical protein
LHLYVQGEVVIVKSANGPVPHPDDSLDSYDSPSPGSAKSGHALSPGYTDLGNPDVSGSCLDMADEDYPNLPH